MKRLHWIKFLLEIIAFFFFIDSTLYALDGNVDKWFSRIALTTIIVCAVYIGELIMKFDSDNPKEVSR